jgi:hypothetical protein
LINLVERDQRGLVIGTGVGRAEIDLIAAPELDAMAGEGHQHAVGLDPVAQQGLELLADVGGDRQKAGVLGAGGLGHEHEVLGPVAAVAEDRGQALHVALGIVQLAQLAGPGVLAHADQQRILLARLLGKTWGGGENGQDDRQGGPTRGLASHWQKPPLGRSLIIKRTNDRPESSPPGLEKDENNACV